MKVSQLIETLSRCKPDTEVVFKDMESGGARPVSEVEALTMFQPEGRGPGDYFHEYYSRKASTWVEAEEKEYSVGPAVEVILLNWRMKR